MTLPAQHLSLAVGDLWTAAEANTLWLADDTGWTIPTLSNSWVAFGAPYPAPQYRRLNGVVFLKGLMKLGTLAATVFTLPPDFLPADQKWFSVVGAVGAYSAVIQITTGGILTVAAYGTSSTNAEVSREGITFIAEG